MAAATAIVTVASVSAVGVSLAYQLTRVMLYRAVEVAANTAISLLNSGDAESVGKVQFILMELDIETKLKTVRSLLDSVETENYEESEFVQLCVQNVHDIMDSIGITLTRIQNSMDAHAKLWFSKYRSLNVVDDLELLKAQCKMFDKRLETLVQCLAVPSNRNGSVVAQHSLIKHKIFRENNDEEDQNEIDDGEADLLAARAHMDAEMSPGASSTSRTLPRSKTTVLYEEPVFL